MHLCEALLKRGDVVFGIDNINDYYDQKLKEDRLAILTKYKRFSFSKSDIENLAGLTSIFKKFRPNKVVNLAAQAGVRYSLKNPNQYIKTNILGFMNILECCRHFNVDGLIFASSSSVYGGNSLIPFSESHSVDKPISIYAASKKANELMAYSYMHLYGINMTGLRFFTVYGPWGRPDMAMFIFANNILKGNSIPVFNHGKMIRDFTFIDDIIKGIVASIDKNFEYEIFNLGSNKKIELMKVIKILEKNLEKPAKINFLNHQMGDVKITHADINKSKEKLGFEPAVSIELGVKQFTSWYLNYRK